VVLVVLVVAIGVLEPSFFAIASLEALMRQAAIFVLLCGGLTLIIMTGGIDLSYASLASLITVLLALWLPRYGAAALLFVLVLGVTAGALIGYVQAKTQVASFIVTLGAQGVFVALALVISGAATISVVGGYGLIAWINGQVLGVPTVAIIAIVFTALGWSALRWLPIGREIRAIGSAEKVAELSGIRPTLVRVVIFGVSGLCSVLGAIALVAQQQSGAPGLADTLLLPGIAAVVIGGTAITGGVGGLPQTIVGALILSVLRVGMGVLGINPLYDQIGYGLLLIIAIAISTDRSKIVLMK
jgi:ribose transport system permease protein